MPDAARILIVALAAAGAAACHKDASQNAAANQDMSIEGNLAAAQPTANLVVETLPPDESSGTSSGELNAGDDDPDVNDLSSSH